MYKKPFPKNWTSIPIKNLLSFVLGGDWGKDPLKFESNDYELAICIRGSEIKHWKINKSSTAVERLIKKSSLEKRTLFPGDVVIEISGGGPEQPVGRTIYIDEDSLKNEKQIPSVCTNFLRLMRFYPVVNSKFIQLYLQLFYDSGQVINYQGGSNNLRNLKFKEFETIQIPLPPRLEQDLIVAKVDGLMAKVEAMQKSLERIPQLLKDFRQQVLTKAVTGSLTEGWSGADNWKKTSIGKLFDVKTGATPKRGNISYFENGTIPWLKSGQVKNELVFEAEEYITEKAIEETNAKIYPIDSLLVAMYGEGKTRGQVGWLKIEAASNQAIAALVNQKMDLITKKFIYYYCLSQYHEIRAKAEGGNQPNLNLSKIKAWGVLLPPIEEQREIVQFVDRLFEIAETLEKKYKMLKVKIDSLPQAILHKAFKGELVEPLPGDGDAKELLEEIQKMKKG